MPAPTKNQNWKTTATGVLTILVAVAGAGLHWLKTGTVPDLATTLAALTAGWGLIAAKDSNA
jgi:hypothetical protein